MASPRTKSLAGGVDVTSSRRSSLIAGVLAAAIACAPLPAFAKEPSTQDLDTARALFNEGNDLKDAGDLKGALERYLAADELAHTAVTGLEVGKTYLALGKLATAHDRFMAVLRIPEGLKDSPNVKSARADAAVIAKEIEPRIPAVTFRMGDDNQVAPIASVEVDGVARTGAKFGEPITLDPGNHVIVVRAAERPERKVTIEAREGERQVVVLTYAPPKPPPKSDEPSSPVAAAQPFDGTRVLVYGGLGLAAAGAIVGTVTGIITLSRASNLRDSCEGGRCPPEVHDDRASVTRMGNISTVAFIVAGAGVLTGTIGLLSAPRSSEIAPAPSALRMTPFIGIGFLGLKGSF
jgi:hypothetical protein